MRGVSVKLAGSGRRGGEGTRRRRGAQAGGHDNKKDSYRAKTPHTSETHATSVRDEATESRIDNIIPGNADQAMARARRLIMARSRRFAATHASAMSHDVPDHRVRGRRQDGHAHLTRRAGPRRPARRRPVDAPVPCPVIAVTTSNPCGRPSWHRLLRRDPPASSTSIRTRSRLNSSSGPRSGTRRMISTIRYN
jgi:hypothetical protein